MYCHSIVIWLPVTLYEIVKSASHYNPPLLMTTPSISLQLLIPFLLLHHYSTRLVTLEKILKLKLKELIFLSSVQFKSYFFVPSHIIPFLPNTLKGIVTELILVLFNNVNKDYKFTIIITHPSFINSNAAVIYSVLHRISPTTFLQL